MAGDAARDSCEIVTVTSRERLRRWLILGAIVVGWIVLMVFSQVVSNEDDAIPLWLVITIIPYLIYSVPRAMRHYELRCKTRDWKQLARTAGATAGALYVVLFLLLLAWHPAGVADAGLHALASYFYPLTLILRLFGIMTWMSW